jgi:hypothetical protein
MTGPTLAEVEARLHALYVGVPDAGLRADHRKKAREVTPLLGELAALLARRARGPVTLVDAAAGKAYVGLLAAELVLARGRRSGRITVIEREPDRAELVRAAAAPIAAATGIAIAVEEAALAAAAWPPQPDLVVALHACGPAADDVIAGALSARAAALLLVPCCYGAAVAGEARAAALGEVLGIPRQAPVRRRFAMAVVDAERTLRLEAAGYETRVVELFSPQVSPHNLIWRALRVEEPVRMARAAEQHARLVGGAVLS